MYLPITLYMHNEMPNRNPFYGKNHTQETLSRLSALNSGGKNKAAKKVIDTNTNQIFGCIKEAAEFYKINYSTLKSGLSNKSKKYKSLTYAEGV